MMKCVLQEQTRDEILRCPSQWGTPYTSSLAQLLLCLHAYYTAVGHHNQDRRHWTQVQGTHFRHHRRFVELAFVARRWARAEGREQRRARHRVWSEGHTKENYLPDDLCSFSRNLIIHCSGRVVKWALSFYGLLLQTSSNYKLDPYPGLFIAWPCHHLLL